jgi:16S rRNA (adenine1518-N6/adenine1519-N6)-dimethyltransferase
VLKLIISAAELTPEDAVIEVGPGLGVLTGELAERAACLAAVELDSNLAAILRQSLALFNNVTVINDNILKLNPGTLLQKLPSVCPGLGEGVLSYKVVANLPYYIASPVLRLFLETVLKPRLMVVMLQKEVAQAITAKPGRMSLQSVSVQFYGAPEIVAVVPARCFYPAPEVDSAILRIRVYPEPPLTVNEAGFFGLVRGGFTAARKQLPNSLSQGLNLPKAEVTAWLEAVGIEPRRRAGTISLEEWAKLWRVFDRARGEG